MDRMGATMTHRQAEREQRVRAWLIEHGLGFLENGKFYVFDEDDSGISQSLTALLASIEQRVLEEAAKIAEQPVVLDAMLGLTGPAKGHEIARKLRQQAKERGV